MSSIEKFKKHINQNITIELTNKDGEKDDFQFKPLNAQQFGLLMVLGDRMNKSDGMDKEDAKDLMGLYLDIVKNAYPELDDETASNFAQLAEAMTKLAPDMDQRKSNALKKIKDIQRTNAKDLKNKADGTNQG